MKHKNLLLNFKQENHPVCYSAVPILAFLVNLVTSICIFIYIIIYKIYNTSLYFLILGILISSIYWFKHYNDFEDSVFNSLLSIIILSLIVIAMTLSVYIFV